jgi:hypothetical protein
MLLLQLSDAAADGVADRLEEFVSYCAPPSKGGEFTVSELDVLGSSHPEVYTLKFTCCEGRFVVNSSNSA